MVAQSKSLQEEVSDLTLRGDLLYYSMANDLGKLSDDLAAELKKNKIKLPSFDGEYESWYSEALSVIDQVIPARVEDFVKQYKNEKRKEVDFLTYGISDYLVGLTTRRYGDVIADKNAALPKMKIQVAILKSAEKRFESKLFDIHEVLMADLFDSELEAAAELNKNGFTRGAGAIAGVVLEKHLGHVCAQHGLKTRKKHPTISDFNEMLKKASTISTAKWRFIQHLGDVRNLCDHNKGKEPTKDDVNDLIAGVDKVVKTVF